VFDYLEELNEVQREAVMRTEGPSMIVAGAGSGKTRVLTYRIAHLLKQGVRPSTILALTFTNKAAGEMKSRIAALVGENLSKYLWMGTFHSIFARILRYEHESAGYPSDYTIYDASDSKSAIKSILKDFQLDDKIYRPGAVAHRISMAKNNLITPAFYFLDTQILDHDHRIQMPRICEIYSEYVRRCKLSNAMDFDDLLFVTNILFHEHPEVLERYQQKFDYILVDEYQDTNYAQYLIIQKLASQHGNLCIVGDDAQSIYSFRGARIENIFNFQKDYPDHKVFKLEQNYRSTQMIVNAANSVIAHNKKQISKTIFSKKEKGNRIRVIEALSDAEEGFRIAGTIAEIILRDHCKNDDFAILYRTNAQSRIFEESLRKRDIPYKIYGGLSFYQRKEIKDLLSWFRLIINPDDNEALKRVINYPPRGIGQTTITKLESQAINNSSSIWKTIGGLFGNKQDNFNSGTLQKLKEFVKLADHFREMVISESAVSLARSVVNETGILKELYSDNTQEGRSRYENIDELLNGIRDFCLTALEEDRGASIGDYLQEVSLLTDQDNEKDENKNKVTLMTVHAAKGLEFKFVFIVGLEKNLFPSSQPGQPVTKEEYEEERRLFYVALTRAEQQVFLSHAGQRFRWGKTEFCQPSPFIDEIDPETIEFTAQTNGFTRGKTMPGMSVLFDKSENENRISKISATLKTGLHRKIDSLINENSNPLPGDAPETILPGSTVEHQRFGIGKVLQIEGTPPDLKATVFFHNAGQKILLLRFARLRIIR
jgi:DNA helicase II / ATP-dependent DNA helicase PcrA